MGAPRKEIRKDVNRTWHPFEFLSLLVLTALTGATVQQILKEPRGLELKALGPMSSNPLRDVKNGNREPASISSPFQEYRFDCRSAAMGPEVIPTEARKLRITGQLDQRCFQDASAATLDSLIVTSSVGSAEVFVDRKSGRFATTYLNLPAGTTEVSVELMFSDGIRALQKLKFEKL